MRETGSVVPSAPACCSEGDSRGPPAALHGRVGSAHASSPMTERLAQEGPSADPGAREQMLPFRGGVFPYGLSVGGDGAIGPGLGGPLQDPAHRVPPDDLPAAEASGRCPAADLVPPGPQSPRKSSVVCVSHAKWERGWREGGSGQGRREDGAELRVEGIEVDVLDRLCPAPVAVQLAAALGLADAAPVGGTV